MYGNQSRPITGTKRLDGERRDLPSGCLPRLSDQSVGVGTAVRAFLDQLLSQLFAVTRFLCQA